MKVYKCDVCGNIVELLHEGGGELVCCGKPMTLLEPKTEDKGMEKHVPEVTVDGDVITVKVGSVAHPMEDKHYIEWVEVITEDRVLRKFLKPGQEPQAKFICKSKVLEVRSYCNLHGLWVKKL